MLRYFRLIYKPQPSFLVQYSSLISWNLNFVDSCLQSFYWINFAVPLTLPEILSKLPHLQCFMHAHMPYYHTHKLIWQLFIRTSQTRRLGDGKGYNHVRNGSYDPWLSHICNCSVDQLVKSTSVKTWLRQLLLNMFFLALLVPCSYFELSNFVTWQFKLALGHGRS